MKNILRKMGMTKILKINEFTAINESLANNVHVREVTGNNLSIQAAEHLFECNVTQPYKIENAVIVLPYSIENKVTVDSLSLHLTKFVKDKRGGKSSGFSIGRYFAGDYKSGESVWNEKSICVSLVGEISDREGTIATAVEIMRVYHLPRILILNETCALELTQEGGEANPLPQHRIKRIGE